MIDDLRNAVASLLVIVAAHTSAHTQHNYEETISFARKLISEKIPKDVIKPETNVSTVKKRKTYITDYECSVCSFDLSERLNDHVFTNGGNDFENTCPVCGTVFEVEVYPIPTFTLTRKMEHGR